jgi:sortase A
MRARSPIELAAWILGIALLGTYAAARVSFEAARAAGVEAFREISAARSSGPAKPPAQAQAVSTTVDIDQSLWSQQRIRSFAQSQAYPEKVQGLLRIPALELEVPIYDGTTDRNLDRGAAVVEGTAPLSSIGDPGNVGIAAHRDGFFRKLKDVVIDDELQIDAGGRTLVYEVVELSIVEPDEVGVLAPTERPSVTLVTCFPFYFVGTAPQRYIVRAQLKGSVRASLRHSQTYPELQTTRTPASRRNTS